MTATLASRILVWCIHYNNTVHMSRYCCVTSSPIRTIPSASDFHRSQLLPGNVWSSLATGRGLYRRSGIGNTSVLTWRECFVRVLPHPAPKTTLFIFLSSKYKVKQKQSVVKAKTKKGKASSFLCSFLRYTEYSISWKVELWCN
jgi:hypothetical protein